MVRSIFRHMRHASSAACLFVPATCAVLVLLAAEGPLAIDFRSVRVTRPDLEFVGGSGMGGGIGGTGKAIAPPVTVRMVDTESVACSDAQRYATVELLNNSSNPILIPWDPDGSKIVEAKSGEDQLNFETLTVTIRSKSQPELFVTQELFGRASVPTSRAAIPRGGAASLRGILLPGAEARFCGSDLIVEAGLSSNQAVRSGKGYLLNSKDRWRVRSR